LWSLAKLSKAQWQNSKVKGDGDVVEKLMAKLKGDGYGGEIHGKGWLFVWMVAKLMAKLQNYIKEGKTQK
jgi:hypothetical protein